MKTKIAVIIFISILLVSCAPTTPTQEIQVDVAEGATQEIVTEVPATQISDVIQETMIVESPSVVPTESPMVCVTLLTPVNGAEIPPVGKVTFSWTPVNGAGNYVLKIILPSGNVVPFETTQIFRDRYMEAFTAGGEYQWQVVAQDENGNEMCVSEVVKFEKSVYQPPKNSDGNGNGDNGGNSGSGETCPDGSSADPVYGCDGG
jgi:hypothetical protein